MITRRIIKCQVVAGMLLTLISSLQAGQQHANSFTSSRVRQAASDPRSTAKARPTVLRTELKQLREEVRHLRRDVQRLVQLLEAQLPESSENSNAREERPIGAQNEPSATELSENAIRPRTPPSDRDLPLATWNLTLKDAIIIGLENSPALKVTTRQGAKDAIIVGSNDKDTASTEAQVIGLIREIEDAYGDLWTAHGDFQAMRQARESSLVLWRQIVRNANSSPSLLEEEATVRNQFFHFRTQVNQSLQSRQAKERRLRAVLGLAADDGQTIIPADLPNRSTSSVNWEENRNEAFANSRAIQEQRAVVRQRELQPLTRESNEAASPENGADEPETKRDSAWHHYGGR